MQLGNHLDFQHNEARNLVLHVLAADPSTPVEGQVYYNSALKVIRFYLNGVWATFGRLDQLSAPGASVSMGGQRVTNVATPTADTDAANKGYVDALAQSISWKAPVRAATTGAASLAGAFTTGSVVDGVTLATGDRILIKDQAAPAENGIYTVNGSGAPTRATDADTAAEILQAACFVEEGTVNADRLYVLATNLPLVLGTTGLTFVQLAGATAYAAGNGISIVGTTISVVAGTGLTVAGGAIALSVPVGVANGGTGGTTPGTARAALGVPGRYAAAIGDGSTTSIVVNHNLGTTDVIAQVRRVAAPNDVILVETQITDANNVTVVFSVAPTSGQYRAVVMG